MNGAANNAAGDPPVVFLLKQPTFGPSVTAAEGRHLPYRADLITRTGVQPRWSDRPAHLDRPRGLSYTLEGLERLGAPPTLQMTSAWRQLIQATAVLAMFESEGNAFALARMLHVPGARRPRFGVISCWLAELLPYLPAHRRAAYQRAYRSVDRLYYFSANQTEIYQQHLQIPAERLKPIRFGVDVDGFAPAEVDVGDFVLVVGRDRGRDWPTTFAALSTTGLPARVLCRPSDVRGHAVPDNVEIVGYVAREVYRDHLARARVVVVATRPMAYPTGQSVALEAMAMGKYCVVTETEAFKDYIVPGAVATVPPGDPEMLADAIRRAYDDADLRAAVGKVAAATARERFSAGAMWSTIVTDLMDSSSDGAPN